MNLHIKQGNIFSVMVIICNAVSGYRNEESFYQSKGGKIYMEEIIEKVDTSSHVECLLECRRKDGCKDASMLNNGTCLLLRNTSISQGSLPLQTAVRYSEALNSNLNNAINTTGILKYILIFFFCLIELIHDCIFPRLRYAKKKRSANKDPLDNAMMQGCTHTKFGVLFLNNVDAIKWQLPFT